MTYDEFREALKTQKPDGTCPVGKTLNILRGKWTTKIIFELQKGERFRFGELKRKLPEITNTMLSSTLKELENLGIVKREQFNEIPPHTEYSLTDAGRDMLPVFYEMALWGQKYL